MSYRHNIIYSVLLILFVFIFHAEADAQRGKKKKDVPKESILREAEFYFTEGEKYFILEDYAKAMVLFQKSLEVNPENATVYYKMAQIQSRSDEPTEALTNILKALELEQNNKFFYVLASDIYTQMGNFEKSTETLEIMISRLQNTDQYLFELAALYLYQKRYDDALRIYDKIETAYGVNEETTTQKQKIYLQINDIEKALTEGEKLIEAFPGQEQYVIKQAEILLANNQDKRAATFLQKYLLEEESAQARLVLADLFTNEGKFEEAFSNYKQAFSSIDISDNNKIQILADFYHNTGKSYPDYALNLSQVLIETHPESANVYALYADILYGLGKKTEAKDQYLNALRFDESNFTVWQNSLQLLSELNKIDSVIIISEKAAELFPNQGSLYYYNGTANLQKRNYEDAITALEYGKRLSSSNLGLVSAFNGMLGDAYNGAKNYDKSDRAYDAALDYDPNNYVVLNNYSYYLALRKEHLDKAEKMSAKTVKDNPDNATYLDTYAWVLFAREKYKEAKKVIEQAIKTGNVTAIHFEHYGDILYKLGDIDGAVAQWQKAKGLNPNSELIDKKITNRKLYE